MTEVLRRYQRHAAGGVASSAIALAGETRTSSVEVLRLWGPKKEQWAGWNLSRLVGTSFTESAQEIKAALA
jgi:hypothetical protein